METSKSVFWMSLWASVVLLSIIGAFSFSGAISALALLIGVGGVYGFLAELFRLNGVDHE